MGPGSQEQKGPGSQEQSRIITFRIRKGDEEWAVVEVVKGVGRGGGRSGPAGGAAEHGEREIGKGAGTSATGEMETGGNNRSPGPSRREQEIEARCTHRGRLDGRTRGQARRFPCAHVQTAPPPAR